MRLPKHWVITVVGLLLGGIFSCESVAQHTWFDTVFPEVAGKEKSGSGLLRIDYDANVICLGAESRLTLDYSLYGPGHNLTFQWYLDNNLLGENTTLSFTPGNEGEFAIRAELWDDGLLQARDTVTIYVTHLPIFTIVSDTVCKSMEATIGIEGGRYWAWSTQGTTQYINVRPGTDNVYRVRISNYPILDAGYENTCYSDTSVIVTVHDTAVFRIEGAREACAETEVEIRVTDGSDVSWNGVSGESVRNIFVSGDTVLQISATDRYGCRARKEWPITAIEKPEGRIIAYVDGLLTDTVCIGRTVRLEVESDIADQYRWFNRDTSYFTEFTPKTDILAYCDISAGTSSVCKTRLEKSIWIKNCSKVFFASGFVIGGLSKTYGPIGQEDTTRTYHFSVYNQNGVMLYSTTEFSKGWDGRYKGKIVPPGVYVYVFRESFDRFRWERKGTFTVIK